MKRFAGATGLALGLGALSGVYLLSDDVAKADAEGARLATRRAAAPAVVETRSVAALEPGKVIVTARPPAAPAPVQVASSDPRDLARALPEARAADRLAAQLRDPDTDVAVAAAAALGTTREGRALLVEHLARPVESPGLDHLACLEALAGFGRVEDLSVVMPWTARVDATGDLACWCVRAICERERVDVPEGMRDPVPELDAEVRGDAGT